MTAEDFLDDISGSLDGTDLPGLPFTFSYTDEGRFWNGAPLYEDGQTRVGVYGDQITFDIQQNVTGGTMTGISAFEGFELDPDYQFFYFVGFSINVVDFAAATMTLDPLDDLAVLDAMLSGNDTLMGTSVNDYMFAGNGNDRMEGGNGSDTLEGDAGNDSLYGGADFDILEGGAGADLLDGGDGFNIASYLLSSSGVTVDRLFAGTNTGDAVGDVFVNIGGIEGSDFGDALRGDNLSEYLYGREGNDTLFGRGGNDDLYGDDNSDLIYGGDGNDNLWGDNFSVLFGLDTLDGGLGNDSLFGGEENDVLVGGAGADFIDGGFGTRDLASYWNSATGLRAVLLAPAGNTGDAAGDSYVGIEDLGGTGFSDVLGGDNEANRILGGNGNDDIDGFGGNDSLYGGDGNDRLIGNVGADLLDGGGGTYDGASYWNASGLRADLAFTATNTGHAAGDIYVGIENLQGSLFNDTLGGDNNANTLGGLAGNDALDGRGGNDTWAARPGMTRWWGARGTTFWSAARGRMSSSSMPPWVRPTAMSCWTTLSPTTRSGWKTR